MYSDDGENIPHIHITDSSNGYGKNVDFCIKLDTNETFIHGVHNKISAGVLTSKFNDAFNKFMKCKNKKANVSNWEYAVSLWNASHSDSPVTVTSMPDYSLL